MIQHVSPPRAPSVATVLCALAVLAAGCTFDRAPTGDVGGVRCSANDACPPSFVCVVGGNEAGRCAPADAPCIASVDGDVARTQPDGNACGDGRICAAGRCVAPTCGDGVVTAARGETCDGTDGCRADCTACGDNVVDPGEQCDFGARNSDTERDACRTDCSRARCGDDVLDQGESCDDGAANDDEAPDACRTNCARSSCGDGVVDEGEECDDGDGNDDRSPGACRTSCVRAWCGDGVVDAGEVCDEGPSNSDARPNACRTTCTPASCGDGIRDVGEGCDDGAANDDALPDACRTTCARAACGDGVVDAGEECDDGAGNDDVLAGACRTTCVPAHCGDGVVDASEVCDEGPSNSDARPNACRTTCTPASCGDGIRDVGEGCDDGAANDDALPDACRTTCARAACGDGVVDDGESCDEGVANDDVVDGACRTDCSPARCGDGVLDRGLGEGCDDGVANDDTVPNHCRTDCRPAGCGDGTRDRDEQCDDGAQNSDVAANACRTDCATAHCGDGVVDGVEECDDGVDNGPGRRCLADCRVFRCGDGDVFLGDAVSEAEECDDGNDDPFDGCVPGCRRNVCGDRLVNADGSESCDDGNTTSFDGCSSTCTNEIWRRRVGDGVAVGAGLALAALGAPPVMAVLVGTSDGALVATALDDGNELWRLAMPGAIAAVAVRAQRAVVATGDGSVVGVDLDAVAPQVAFARTGVAATGGRAQLSLGSQGETVFVDDHATLRVLSVDGNDAPLLSSGSTPYLHPIDAVVDGLPATCGPSCSLLSIDVPGGPEPAAALAAFVGGVLFWHVRAGCAPQVFGMASGAHVLGRPAFFSLPDFSAQFVVAATSVGELLVVSNNGDLNSCNANSYTRMTASLRVASEPVLFQSVLANDAVSVLVAGTDAVLHSYRVNRASNQSLSLEENFGWPAPLPEGRTVRVPPALDLQQNAYVVDDGGGVYRFDVVGGRSALGELGAQPAAGLLVTAHAVVAVGVDGTLTAFEGGGDDVRAPYWTREGGDVGNAGSSTLCSSTSPDGLAPMGALSLLLALLRRRGRRTAGGSAVAERRRDRTTR